MESDREKFERLGRVLKIAAGVVAHQLISTVGVIVLSDFLTYGIVAVGRIFDPIFTPKLAGWLLTQIPGFPVQATVGLVLGFLLGKFMQRKIMVWMWVLPLGACCWVMIFPPADISSPFVPYIRSNASAMTQLLDRLSYSFPAISAAAYALGAKLANQRAGRRHIAKDAAASA